MREQARWILLLLATAGLTACAEPADVADGPVGVVEAALTASKTFQRGKYGTVVDTTISAVRLRENFGDERKLVVSKRHESLLRFDLASIPAQAVITSATLTLYLHGHDGDDDRCDDDDDRRDNDRRGYSAVPIQIHLATAGWKEDKVTYAKFDQAFLSTAAGVLLPSGDNTYKSVDLKAAVQSWVNGSRANHGIVLRTTTRKRWAFAASENSRVALRPALTITYATPDDHCSPNPCLQGGTCTNGWSGYTCQCPPGYAGARCESNIDDCSGTPCQNGGVCSDGVGSYTCSCASGFGGAHCETNIDDCAGSPCQNGGVCTDGLDSFTCACAIGYSGATCDTLIDQCASSPCRNDGTCTNGVGTYTCACAPGFTGTDCEVNVDDCAGTPCKNGGSCEDGVHTFSCNCAGGFTGPTCETNIDDCASAPCKNGGECVDATLGYTCQCRTGFAGTNCDINIDDCVAYPCQNGGTCVDGDATFTCECAPGYGGATCQADLDDCTPNPCQNGGVCTDGINSHSCDCPLGYTGPNCETSPPVCGPLGVGDNLIGHWTFEPLDGNDDLEGNFGPTVFEGDATVTGGQLDVNAVLDGGPNGRADATGWAHAGDYIGTKIRAKTLVSWVALDSLDIRSGSALTLDHVSADRFDGVVYAENVARRWMNGSNDHARTQNVVSADETALNVLVQIAISYKDLGAGNVEITLCRDGVQIGQYTRGSMAEWPTGEAEVIFGQRHTFAGGGERGGLDAKIEEARIYNTALSCACLGSLTIHK